MIYTYQNPWHNQDDRYSRPLFECEKRPTEYKGYKIYHRIKDCFDIVKDGVCISQMAGLNGAKKAIDKIKRQTKGPLYDLL